MRYDPPSGFRSPLIVGEAPPEPPQRTNAISEGSLESLDRFFLGTVIGGELVLWFRPRRDRDRRGRVGEEAHLTVEASVLLLPNHGRERTTLGRADHHGLDFHSPPLPSPATKSRSVLARGNDTQPMRGELSTH